MRMPAHLSATKFTHAHDVNNIGQVVGESSLGPLGGYWAGEVHAFLWENNSVIDLA